MYRPMAAAIGFALLSTAATAQTTGVAVCDDFITKYDACITGKVPQAQQATFKSQLDQMRKAWGDMAKTPQGKTQLESMCKMQADQMKVAMQPQGCTF